MVPGLSCRIHLCKFNPCSANYSLGRYNLVRCPVLPVDMHLQQVPTPDVLPAVAVDVLHPLPPPDEPPPDLVEVVAPPLPPLPPPAEPPPDLVELPAAPAAEPSLPVRPPSPEPPPSAELLSIGLPDVHLDDLLELPDVPVLGVLAGVKPAAPTLPLELIDDVEVIAPAVAVRAVVGTIEAARHKIRARMLALAREIRKQREPVGYSAFVLFALLKNSAVCMWEGGVHVDLLDTFAPWAKDSETKSPPYAGIPCTLVATPGCMVECMPVSEKYPLRHIGHFVAGCPILGSAVAGNACGFDDFYAARGVATFATIADGDCAFDVMKLMLGESSTFESRTGLRIELADYLTDRADALWMHELMVRLGEVDADDLKTSMSQEVQPEELDITTTTLVAAPAFPAPAKEAADEAPSENTVDEETFNALQWASRLSDYSSVLSLIQSLPKEIVREQVMLYRNRDAETAVAAATKQKQKTRLNPKSRYTVKMLVAARFHTFCQSRGVVFQQRMPYGLMKQFIEDNIIWNGKNNKHQLTSKTIREWYTSWSGQHGSDVNAVAGQGKKVRKEMSFLKSRAPVAAHLRLRGFGGGRKYRAPLIRRALYEWFTSIRYAIDWKQLVENRRSRGKKHLARFPRSVLRVKVNQLQADQAAACILHGVPSVAIKADSWWFKRWEEEFGLSMRQANRKYAVPRHVQKERMEIFWIVLFRVRLFIFMVFGYDPWILNWDQSPFHHNESGAQNKPTSGIRGSIVPVVEGNSDVKSRWIAQLMTSSRFPAGAGSSSSSK